MSNESLSAKNMMIQKGWNNSICTGATENI